MIEYAGGVERVAFISDIHANLVALDAVLADIDALDGGRGADTIVCLGDIVDLGPQPQETVDRLRERKVVSIRGNHDTLDENPGLPVLAAVESWSRNSLDEATQAYLNGLPTELELTLGTSTSVLAVHGSPRAVHEDLLDATPREVVAGWLEGRSCDVLIAGHTHLQLLRRIDGVTVVNAGSVGMPFLQPFSGKPPTVLPYAEYAVLSHAQGQPLSVDLRQVSYDFDRFAAETKASSFPEPDAWLSQWRR